MSETAPARPGDLSRRGAVELVRGWIRDRQAGSLVRFGEGEGRLLCADPADPVSMGVAMRKLRRQTGLQLGDDDVLRVRAQVLRAFDDADVVGIRGNASFAEEHLMWVRLIDGLYAERLAARGRPGLVTHCLVSNNLRDALGDLLAGQAQVSVVSCRNIGSVLAEKYGVPDVAVYQIPSQYVMRRVDDEYERAMHDVPMWPAFYDSLKDSVQVRSPGEVFLVGAGLFGKELCVHIRSRGGIALDLGSCLDGLVGKVTRGAGKPSVYP